MAFCSGCGAQVADGTAFCNKCGKPVAAGNAPSQSTPAHTHNPGTAGGEGTSGLAENVAGALCYALWWITGLIFLFTDKRPSVKFHAAQSIVVGVGITIAYIIIGQMFAVSIMMGGLGAGWTLGYTLHMLLQLGSLILWIFLMFKAYQGERFRVPIAANIADSFANKT
jgi:uncharacterized membrane protein